MRTVAKSLCVRWPSVNARAGQILCVPTIDLKIHFILRKDDENYKEDDDNFVTEINEYLKGISKKSNTYPWSLEDSHNEFRGWENHPMKNDYHCWWFHCLYDHNHLEWEDMLKIGEFWSDLKVYYQYFD